MIRTLCGLAVCYIVSQAAVAAPILVNGDFETGDFSGWTVGSTQVRPFEGAIFRPGYSAIAMNDAGTLGAWAIRDTQASFFGGNPATPISGYSAFNGFNGSRGELYLKQDFAFSGGPSAALLTFDWALQSDCCVDRNLRNFSVNLLDSAGALVSNIFDYTQPEGAHLAWNIQDEVFDLGSLFSSLASDVYTLEFLMDVPGTFTGPAQFAIDNIFLDIEPSASVPEPGSLLLLGLGLVGIGFLSRKKVV
jgi:hypothetical protein